MSETWELNLKTPKEDYCREEQNKLAQGGTAGSLTSDFADQSIQELQWESEQLAKSHGIYLEFNRDVKGKEKDWMYMLRMTIPGGGPLNKDQWDVLDDISDRYTTGPDNRPSLRLTTRQNIQFHWLKKQDVPDVVRRVADSGFYALNGCGDNVRNVMGCPLSRFSKTYNAHAHAEEFGHYFQLPLDPHLKVFGIDPSARPRQEGEKFQYGESLLNRKFKIAFAATVRDSDTGILHADNCVECRTNDIGIAPVIENDTVTAFQVYLGGGQGEKNGKPSLSRLGEPFAIFSAENLKAGLDAIVAVQQEWGDRQNRIWARMKFVIKTQGVAWFQDRVRERIGDRFDNPNPHHDPGARHLHHGWMKQESDDRWTYGMFVENGRIHDDQGLASKRMVKELIHKYDARVMVTPNQDLLFTDLEDDQRNAFAADLEGYGYGTRDGVPYSELRRRSVACVGLPTCRLSYSDSERMLPELIDELDQRGWGDMTEALGISGCERQCSRPATKTIGWVGSGRNRYQLRLFGGEDARHQGNPLKDQDGKPFLKMVPRDRLADVIETLFAFYRDSREEGEAMGCFHRRIGMDQIVTHLQTTERTQDLYRKPKRQAP